MNNKVSNKSLPCIICEKELENVVKFDSKKDVQPYNGLVFISYGHYGSTFFDPMNGDTLILNVCDDCVKKAYEKNKII